MESFSLIVIWSAKKIEVTGIDHSYQAYCCAWVCMQSALLFIAESATQMQSTPPPPTTPSHLPQTHPPLSPPDAPPTFSGSNQAYGTSHAQLPSIPQGAYRFDSPRQPPPGGLCHQDAGATSTGKGCDLRVYGYETPPPSPGMWARQPLGSETESELDKEEHQTDEFRMYEFKVRHSCRGCKLDAQAADVIT